MAAAFWFLFSIFLLQPFSAILINAQSSPLQIKSERGFPKHGVSTNKIATRANTLNVDYRLPLTVVPTNYILEFIPILDVLPPNQGEYKEFTAPGFVQITVASIQALATTITLHKSPVLEVTSVTVEKRSTGEDISLQPLEYDEPKDFLILTLDTPLELGSIYLIKIQFVAPIRSEEDGLDGIYRSFYTRPNSDEKIYLATTQFQSVFARQAFPCFDEPHLKATFDIRIGRIDGKHIALSNSKLKLTSPNVEQPGWVWDDFETTVPMSTYLIALIVSDFTPATAAEGLYRLLVKVYAPPHFIEDGGGLFAAETSAKQLALYERLYEVNYTMHKMDSVAVPHFDAGAMENWGLNMYRPQYLLHFDGITTERSRGLISNILAHELAHQWFGNLVTSDWWSALWLNEGFATYVSYIGWEETHPEFEPLKFFVNDAFQYSMQVDGNPGQSHPVLNDALTPDEIEDTFDGITYEKGGALIRMMEGFLGKEILRQGLVLYLKDMSYKGANQNDLFRNLNYKAQEEGLLPEGGVTLKDVMDTWTLQSSFPLVRVSKFGDDRVLLSQERFSQSTFRKENILDKNNLWFIPVALATEASPDYSDVKPKLWIEPTSGSKIVFHNTSTWLMLNPEATGYYRVLYDQPLTRLILQQLLEDHSIISPQSRSQLLDDYLNFAEQKYVNIETALQLTKYLAKETERIVWEAVLGNLESILAKLFETAAFDDFRRYLAPKLGNVLELIGLKQLPQEKGSIVLLRAILLDWACQMDLPEAAAYAVELFDIWKSNPDAPTIPIPVDMRPIIYCAGVTHGGADNFEFMLKRYESEKDASTKLTFLRALRCAKEHSLLQSILDEILEDQSRIEENDLAEVLQIVAGSNVIGRSLTLSFLRQNVNPIIEKFKGTTIFTRTIATLSSGMATTIDLIDVEAFIAECVGNPNIPEEVIERMKGSLRNIEANIAWRATYEKRLQVWFSENA